MGSGLAVSQTTMVHVFQNWPLRLDGTATSMDSVFCPVEYSDEEARQSVDDYEQEQEMLQELTEMRSMLGT